MRILSGERVNRLTEQIHKLIPEWRLAPVVKALQALRGTTGSLASNLLNLQTSSIP
jgi:hypothetical protein